MCISSGKLDYLDYTKYSDVLFQDLLVQWFQFNQIAKQYNMKFSTNIKMALLLKEKANYLGWNMGSNKYRVHGDFMSEL
jgi:hypothetical protein